VIITRPEKPECDVSQCNREDSTGGHLSPRRLSSHEKDYFIDVTAVRNSCVNSSFTIEMLHVSKRTLITFYVCTNMDAQFENRYYLNTVISNAFNT
jgi:hypothetical protein